MMRMPAETAGHERTVMCWPARQALYGSLLPDAEAAHATVARTIAHFEPVTMIADVGTRGAGDGGVWRQASTSSSCRSTTRGSAIPGRST